MRPYTGWVQYCQAWRKNCTRCRSFEDTSIGRTAIWPVVDRTITLHTYKLQSFDRNRPRLDIQFLPYLSQPGCVKPTVTRRKLDYDVYPTYINEVFSSEIPKNSSDFHNYFFRSICFLFYVPIPQNQKKFKAEI